MNTPFTERFWAKVNKTETCWLWTASVDSDGYGKIRLGGRSDGSTRAHRASYEMAYGPVPPGMLIDHRCHIPACVNPAHLRLATRKQNAENLTGPYRNNLTGARGIWWRGHKGKWEANVCHNRQRHYLGYFSTIEDAESAVIAKRNELFTHNDMDRKTIL